MAVLALLTYPWITMVKSQYHVIPRALADDLSIWGRGPSDADCEQLGMDWQKRWQLAIQATLDYLVDMGAKPAHKKSLLLGSSKRLRGWLRRLKWGDQGHSIPTTGRARDLGAFLNCTQQRMAGLTVTRMRHGCTAAERIGRLPRTIAAKDRMLSCKAMAKACYGVEVTEPRIEDKRRIASRCATALVGKHQTQRSPEVATVMVGKGRAEIGTASIMRRLLGLRRAWHRRDEWREQIRQLLAHLHVGRRLGLTEDAQLHTHDQVDAAPPITSLEPSGSSTGPSPPCNSSDQQRSTPGPSQQQTDTQRHARPTKLKARRQPGPVELFVRSLHQIYGWLSSPETISFRGERAYNFMEAPINWLRPWVKRARTQSRGGSSCRA